MSYENVLERNLLEVFNERNPQKRLQALEVLYTSDAVMYEPDDIVEGLESISKVVDGLLRKMPTGFMFTPEGVSVGHHDLVCMRWKGSSPDESVVLTGTDIAHLKEGRICSLYVLIDPAAE